MTIRRLLTLLFILVSPITVMAQLELSEDDSFLDRVYTGGNVGFSISNNVTSLSISPLAGYMVTDRLSVGLGGTYQVNKFKTVDLTLNNYGVRTFLRYNVTPEFFAYTEYEYLVFEFSNTISEVDTEGFSSFFVGGGYAVPLSEKVSLLAIALYNLAYNDFRSPYPSPIVLRGGIIANF